MLIGGGLVAGSWGLAPWWAGRRAACPVRWWTGGATAALAAWWATQTVSVAVFAVWALFFTVIAMVATVDAYHRIIPNRVIMMVLGDGVIWRTLSGHWLSSAATAVAVLALFAVVAWASRGGLGLGDVKFAAALGWMLGYPAIGVALVSGFTAAGLFAIGLWVLGKKRRTDVMALGPFLSFGAVLAVASLSIR